VKNIQTRTNYQSYMAERVLLALIPAQSIFSGVSGEEKLPSPVAIASFACDIAQQFVSQCRERDWIEEIEKPDAPEAIAQPGGASTP